MRIRAITKAHIHTGWEGLGFFRGVTWRPPTWNIPHQSAILSDLSTTARCRPVAGDPQDCNSTLRLDIIQDYNRPKHPRRRQTRDDEQCSPPESLDELFSDFGVIGATKVVKFDIRD